MTTKLSQGTILVATDRPADASDVHRLLAEEFDIVEVSTREELAVADFERVRPDVIVLAFDTLKKSQEYGLGLLSFSKFAQAHPHRNVILCAGSDLKSVFTLCKKDYFDDYVLYWPQPHDGHRLVMAVWNALRRLAAARDQVPNQAEVAAHARSADALGTVIDRRLDQGSHHVAAAQASLANAERELANSPSHENVKAALAASRESLAPMSEWARGFRTDVAPLVAEVRSLADKFQPPRPFVLVVEDDAFAAKLVGKALEQQGWDLEFALDAEVVQTLLRSRRPAAILMDVNLPGMDGLALTRWLKASPTLMHIPVLMLSGEAKRETIERSKAVGAADFIVKPFTRDALIAKMHRILG